MSETDRIHAHNANESNIGQGPSKLFRFTSIFIILELFEFLGQEILNNLRGLNGSDSNSIIICVLILGLLKVAKILSRGYCIYYLLFQILQIVSKKPEFILLLKKTVNEIKEN